jgi:calcium-dependent protein kinase
MQVAIFQYIANQLISAEEEQELRMIFYNLDENGDGVLSRDELRKGIDVFGEKFGIEGEICDVD